MVDASVRGAEDFLALSRRMKAAGQGELRKELNKAIRQAAKPLVVKTREAAKRDLPQRGGLAARVGKARIRVQTRTGEQTAGVRLAVTSPGVGGADKGVVRHPVFPKPGTPRSSWTFVSQKVPAGWFTGTAENDVPQVRDDITQVLADFTERLAKGR